MAGAGSGPFDAARFGELFAAAGLARRFGAAAEAKAAGEARAPLREVQRRNMAALVGAQRDAASSCQSAFERLVATYRGTLVEAQRRLADEPGEAPAPRAAELAGAAFETAVRNAEALAEAARSANEAALGVLKARIEEGIAELSGSPAAPPR